MMLKNRHAIQSRILVTGAGGFIGSHVTELLLREGYEVRALARYNGRGDIGHLSSLPPELCDRLVIRLGDVTDPFLMRDLVEGCDSVLHLAALIGIPYSYIAPASYIATNVSGTLNVLEACRQAKVRRVIVTSTSEVYGTALHTPIDEKHPLQGQSPYSASKIAADKLAESYFRSFDVPVVILRPFNTFGPRQSARAVIPTVLVQALAGAREIELGNLEAKRDLTFVTDIARAYLLALAAQDIEGETIHFGHGEAFSIGEIAELCLKVVGSQAKIVSAERRLRPEKSEVGLLLCNPTRARALLGWTPQVPFETGIALTAEYVGHHLSHYRVGDYTI
jgi:NAD dependent epimerase/dehydratase